MSHKKLIHQLQEEIGGEIIFGKWGAGPYLVFRHKAFEIAYDYHVVSTGQSAITYSRMRVYMISNSPFTLKVSKEGTMAKLGKIFGGQDIQIGDDYFDDHFIVKSNDDILATHLLNTYEIKSRFSFKYGFTFAIVDKDSMGIKRSEGEKGLTFYTTHHVKYGVELQTLLDLFKYTLDTMLDMNLIREGKTQGVLYKEK